jgi:hypothetical protein
MITGLSFPLPCKAALPHAPASPQADIGAPTASSDAMTPRSLTSGVRINIYLRLSRADVGVYCKGGYTFGNSGVEGEALEKNQAEGAAGRPSRGQAKKFFSVYF